MGERERDDRHLFAHEVLSRPDLEALLRDYRVQADQHGPQSKPAIRVRNRVVTLTMRLMLSVANRYRAPAGFDVEDLHAYGALGLIMAVEKWDAARGCAFSTHASWWVRHAISRNIADLGRVVRVPCHSQDSARLGKDTATAEAARAALQGVCSLDVSATGEEGGQTFLALTPGDSEPTDELLHAARTVVAVRAAVARLPARLRLVVSKREEHTLTEVSAEMGISRETVRSLELEAHRLLRRSFA